MNRALAVVACGFAVFATREASAAEAGSLDPAVVPLAGGDTDVGFGVGLLGSLTRLANPTTNYKWKLAVTGLITFKLDDAGFTSPYQDLVLRLTMQKFLVDRGRFDIVTGITRAQLYYPGLGDASADLKNDYNRYQRAYGVVMATVRLPITPTFLFHETSMGFTHNEASYEPTSRLAMDQQSTDAVVRRGANLPASAGNPLFTQGLVWDSRDQETATSRGMFHRLAVRVSPGGGRYFSAPYVGVGVNLRGYQTVVRDRMIFAWRFVGDALFGSPPTYELGRNEQGWAIGGADGLRGVPQQRYYGAVKAFGTLEMRFWAIDFRLFDQRMKLGGAVFGDAGRVFAAATEYRTDLDGRGLGIKYGLGGGPRIKQGNQFEARFDVAYSPDAKPVGVYVGAGQAF